MYKAYSVSGAEQAVFRASLADQIHVLRTYKSGSARGRRRPSTLEARLSTRQAVTSLLLHWPVATPPCLHARPSKLLVAPFLRLQRFSSVPKSHTIFNSSSITGKGQEAVSACSEVTASRLRIADCRLQAAGCLLTFVNHPAAPT